MGQHFNNISWYLNGEFINPAEARISIMDLGLLRGWGVFEYFRTYHGKLFKVEEHLRRFYESSNRLCIRPPLSFNKMLALVKKLINKNKGVNQSCGIKIILTAGVSVDGLTQPDKPTLAILLFPLSPYADRFYREGIKIQTVKARRTVPEAKSLDYLRAMVALSKAKKEGFDDILYVGEDDTVLEASRSNIFMVRKNKLYTPKTGILSGVTREAVIEVATKDYIVKRENFKLDYLKKADEVFITSTDKEIMPVCQIDNLIIGDGVPGRVTMTLMRQFKEYVGQ